MRSLEVLPSTLPPLSSALSEFAAALAAAPGVPGAGGELQEALAAFVRSWSLALGAVAETAQACATEVVRAADIYAQLEELLIPAAAR